MAIINAKNVRVMVNTSEGLDSLNEFNKLAQDPSHGIIVLGLSTMLPGFQIFELFGMNEKKMKEFLKKIDVLEDTYIVGS